MRYSNMNNFFTKLATTEPDPPPGMGEVIPAKPTPRPPPKGGGGTGSRGAIYDTNDWNTYVEKGNPRDQIKEKWEQINANAGGSYKEGNSSYNSNYDMYRSWWMANGSNLNPAGVIAKFDAIIQTQNTAGGTGTQAVAVDDATLDLYLTTPLTDTQALNRRAILDKLVDTGAVKSIAGGKRYLAPDMSQKTLANARWKQAILAAYTKDDAANDTLSLILTGAPDQSTTVTSGAAGASGTVQPQKSQVGNTISMGGNQYYFTPRGKLMVLVQKGDPSVVYVYDSKNPSDLRPLDTRRRDFITNEERRRLMMLISKEEPQKAPLYEAFFKGQRAANKEMNIARLLRGDQRAEGKKQQGDALAGIKASRQSRLDNLRKKGVI